VCKRASRKINKNARNAGVFVVGGRIAVEARHVRGIATKAVSTRAKQ
jgi:hypothetical protein